MQTQLKRINQKLKWFLISVGVAISIFVAMVLMSDLRLSRMTVYGHAEDYRKLESVEELSNYLGFFPASGKRFYYWCRPYQGDVAGTYEIPEKDFMKWAENKGWKLHETQGIFESIDIPQPNNTDKYVQFRKGLYYQKRVPKESEFMESHEGETESMLDIYYDRVEQKVYFNRNWMD